MSALLLLELRRLLRTPRARLLVGLLFIGTLAASAVGVTLTGAERDAARADVEAGRERLQARFTAPGAFTPVEAAQWTDTVVARPIGPLAALTAGDLDALPSAATLRLGDAPRPVPARVERSPAAGLLGTFDVAWLLTLLLPLAAVALGHDTFAKDRSRGTLAMLLALAPDPGRLVLARTLAVAAVLALGLLPGLTLGLGMAASHLDGPIEMADALAALGLAAAGLVSWSALVIAVSAASARVGQALVGGLVMWAALALVAPLAAHGLGRLAFPAPAPRDRLEAEQAVRDARPEVVERWVEAQIALAPELDPEDAGDGVQSNLRYALLTARARRRRALGARHAERRAWTQRAELASITAYLGPSTMMHAGLAALGGTDPGARARFARALREHLTQLDLHVAKPLLRQDSRPGRLEDWPSFEAAPDPDRGPALGGMLGCLFIAALGLAFARARLARGPVAPDPEET